MGSHYCTKCNSTMDEKNFYSSNNLEKYPNGGRMDICKKCLTLHIDNWDSDTYLWILQEADVPYVPEEWNRILAQYVHAGKTVKSTSILGRYLSTMKLNQYSKYRWADTEILQKIQSKRIEEAMTRQGYSAGEIAEAITKNITPVPKQQLEIPEIITENIEDIKASVLEEEKIEREKTELEANFADNLTAEDRIYLQLKWGRNYKPEEWVRLEQLYDDMTRSYDIQTAGHIDTLKLICKTSLKANQLIDINDIEAFQKMSRVYDQLMKSGNFTAAQNKEKHGDAIDSVGEIIEMCEKQGYIERFYIDQPNDRVDFTIQDMQRYTKTLIEGETNLSNLVEIAIAQNAKEDKDAKENQEFDIVDDIDLTIDDIEKSLEDQDFEDFNEFLEEQERMNEEEEEFN